MTGKPFTIFLMRMNGNNQMIFLEIESDGDVYLPPFGAEDTKRILTVRPETTVMIEGNDDAATVTIGFENSEEEFKAYPDGDITSIEGAEFNTGVGVRLMANVSGITGNSVFLAYSSS